MRLFRHHSPLLVTALIMALPAVVSAVGLVVDDRVLLGAPIWLKPLKFAVSAAVYAVTFGWLISLVQRGRRTAWWLGTVISTASLIEMAVIVGQVLRGRRSHFNLETPLDAALFSLMGITIVVLWLATAGVAVLLLRQRLDDRSIALAVRLSLVIALAGLAIGFLMTSPTPEQVDGMASAAPTTVGAHSVGVPDGGAGLPLLNWSTEGGDLRIGHFIGMHALQALPLFAFALTIGARRFASLRAAQVRTRLVLVVATLYAGLTALVTWQALRGQPLLHPDGLTLAVAAALLLITAVGALRALAGGPDHPASEQAASDQPAPDQPVPDHAELVHAAPAQGVTR